jgi:hypothetical protein
LEKADLSKQSKLQFDVLSGLRDNNIPFEGICNLMLSLGFDHRVKGDHFIFYRNGVDEIVNIQPIGGKAKAYQVKQIRNIIIKYKLGVSNND